MARKPKETVSTEQTAMVDAVSSSAQQIWQAGLGAFAKAQQEGSALFDKLVQEGAELHRLTQQLSGDRLPGVVAKVGQLAENLGRQAGAPWDKIEKIFEDRVARSLRSLGVPSLDDIGALRREIAELKAAVESSPRPKAPAKAVRATASKPAAKKAPLKTASLKTAPPKSPTRARQAKAATRHH